MSKCPTGWKRYSNAGGYPAQFILVATTSTSNLREVTGSSNEARIVGLAGGNARPHRQEWPCAVEGLHLAFFIHRQDDGAVRGTEIQPDDVAHLLHEKWIGRELERFAPVRLDPE